MSARARGILYDIGRWGGAAGAAFLFVAGTLEGAPARYATGFALVALSVSNFIAKKHLAS